MTVTIPHTAMVLAAGHGKRMRPLTLTTPKPLLLVGGRTMLDHALDRLKEAAIDHVVVNAGYLGEQISDHCASRTDVNITVSFESTPLETGGGVKQALPWLGTDPIFVVNADLPWCDSALPALQLLRTAWDATRMDILLLVMPRAATHGFSKGDFILQPDGRLQRKDQTDLPDVFIGVMIIKPELYHPVSEKSFSNNILFDAAEAAGRLYGVVHQGSCYHVGTPDDLCRANQLLLDKCGWDKRGGDRITA